MATMNQKTRDKLTAKDFAFARKRKEPITDARHVRNAIARFDQVEDVIKRAAKKFDVDVSESDWRELFRGAKPKKKR